MTNITNFQDILGAANGDKTSVLGKFLYFSLANILVEKEALNELVDGLFVVNGQVFARGRLARTGMAEIWVLCDGAGGAVWG